MADGGGSAVWPARLRWRLKGALLWPLFWVLTVVDALIMQVLPLTGSGPPNFWGALLLALGANLVAVAVFARIGAWLLRRRRPDMPREVAEDRAGCVLLIGVTALFVVLGAIHAPDRDRAQQALRSQRRAVRAYVLAHAPSYRFQLDHIDTEQHAENFFRTCVPGAPPLCLLIDTSQDPPIVRLDHDRTPNRHL